MQKITFVKKKLENGEWCKKCNDVSARLDKDGTLQYIDNIIIADTNNPQSEGVKLAVKHKVNKAPFFLIQDSKTGSVEVFDIYFKFKRYMETSKQTAA